MDVNRIITCRTLETRLRFNTTVMARSIFLRGFDLEISNMIVEHMERHGTKFLREMVPTKFERTEDGKVKVTYKSQQFGFEAENVFDTVVLAVGRDACTADLGLDKAGVEARPSPDIPHTAAAAALPATRFTLRSRIGLLAASDSPATRCGLSLFVFHASWQ